MTNETQQEILTIAKTLIQYHTVEKNKEAQTFCFEYIKAYFQDVPSIHVKEEEVNGKSSLLLYTHNWQKPEFCFYGHIDVVDAKEDQFVPFVKDQKLFGRGSSDMKGVIAAQMVLFKDLVKSHSDISLALLIVSDEEIGGFNGVNHWVNTLEFSPSCVFIPDGGDNWEFVIGEKGIFQITLTFKGKAAHGARPWLGVNAAELMMETYDRIKSNFLPVAQSEEDILPTVNLGIIQGGNCFNQVMPQVKMCLDIRFPATMSFDDIQKKINEAIPSQVTIEMSKAIQEAPSKLDKENPYVKTFVDILNKEQLLKKEIVSCGGSDARFFLRKGIPALIIKPVCAGHHTNDEWAQIEGYAQLYDVYKKFIFAHKGY